MARKCDLTGTKHQTGHKVSHSNIKTKKKFRPNLQNVSLTSDALGREVSLRITAATLRSVDHNGGLDKFLTTTADSKLTAEAVRLKRQIKKAVGQVAA